MLLEADVAECIFFYIFWFFIAENLYLPIYLFALSHEKYNRKIVQSTLRRAALNV